jgi:hypothetical protein
MEKKFTQSIRFGLTPEQLKRIRAEAQKQKISVSELLRIATENYLHGLSEWRRIVGKRAQKVNRAHLLDTPLVIWNPGEKEFADSVLRTHFEEDR